MVETDKIANDVEAPEAGVIEEVLVPEGETVPVSAPIARWRLGGSSRTAEEAAPATPVRTSKPAPGPQSGQSIPTTLQVSSVGGRILATPYARRLARDANIDLAQVAGSGPHGRIKAQDIAAAQLRRATAIATREPEPDVLSPGPTTPDTGAARAFARADRGRDARPRRHRGTLCRSRTADGASALIGLACARDFPGSSVGIESGGRIVPFPEEGALRARVAKLADGGDVEMASGGAVLIVPGGDATLFAPAAPPGWPAALGVGAAREVLARAPSGEIIATHVMTLALSYDGAAIGNGHAAAFLSALKSQLEDPLVLLAG